MKLFPLLEVDGDNFWGRELELNEFLESTLYSAERGETFCYSLTGMNRIGKSSFVREACRRYRAVKSNNVILIQASIDRRPSFWSFWLYEVINPILDEIAFLDIDDERYLNKIDEIKKYFVQNAKTLINTPDCFETEEAKNQLLLLCMILARCEKSIVLIIDEFDKAKQVFGEDPSLFGWFRDLLQRGDISFSVVTISRRKIKNIEEYTYGGSTLSGTFSQHRLYGFKNSEIDEFFDRLEKKVGELSIEIKEFLWFAAGRSPFYLCLLGNKLIQNQGKLFDKRILSNELIDHFNTTVKIIKQEKLLGKMLQMFVGPIYDLKNSDVDTLIEMGYVISKESLDYRMDRLEYVDYFSKAPIETYTTITPYFEDYLKHVKEEEPSVLRSKIERLEIETRRVITKEMKSRFSDEWRNIINKYCKERNESYFNVLQRSLIKHTKMYDNASPDAQDLVGNSILNVCSYEILGHLIADYFELFKSYSISKSSVERDFFKLCCVRNPFAHSNGKLLSLTELEEAEHLCDYYYAKFTDHT